eukprot:1477935-Alexandrium_andersonii.AAC.1
MHDPALLAAFSQDLSRVPPVSWKVDAHSHLTHLVSQVQDIAARHFPITPVARKPWIDGEALQR